MDSAESTLLPGLVSVTFRALSPDEIIAWSVRAGLAAIEWGGDVHVPAGNLKVAKDVARATVEAGLKVEAYGSYYRLGSEEDFGSILETAAALGAPRIRVWAGNQDSAITEPEQRRKIVNDALRAAALAAPLGITISAEFHAGTLTDSNESALLFAKETTHPNFDLYWQPLNGRETEYCLEGLRTLLRWIGNIHAFHWWPTAETRWSLDEGSDRWEKYLAVLQRDQKPRCVMLEFVKDDRPENFLRDAETLKELIRASAA